MVFKFGVIPGFPPKGSITFAVKLSKMIMMIFGRLVLRMFFVAIGLGYNKSNACCASD